MKYKGGGGLEQQIKKLKWPITRKILVMYLTVSFAVLIIGALILHTHSKEVKKFTEAEEKFSQASDKFNEAMKRYKQVMKKQQILIPPGIIDKDVLDLGEKAKKATEEAQTSIGDAQTSIGEAQNESKKLKIGTPIILVFSIIGVLTGSLAITKILYVKPIYDLLKVTARITEGDLSQKVVMNRQDEYQTLSDAFNQMTEVLKSTIEYQREQINKLLLAFNAAAQGDLTQAVDMNSEDEFGQLGNAFNSMMRNLNQLVSKVDEAVARVTSSASEILAAAQQQAGGVTEQASQISEVASSLQQLTATARQVSESSQQVAKTAESGNDSARHGGKSVSDSIAAMSRIKQTVNSTAKKIQGLGESSRKISKVVTAIQDIAEKTNLLALNAAIEAARAGEAGRGFAVVADEIRKLAEGSSNSTEDINNLISSIQGETNATVMAMEEGTKSVEEGVQLINAAGDALQEIMNIVEQTAELSREISLATEQQTRGNEQVTQAMSNLSQVVKQTEMSARQTISSAQDLTELAMELKVASSELIIKR